MSESEQQLRTIRQFAEQLGVKSTRTIIRYVKARKIVPIRLDGAFRVQTERYRLIYCAEAGMSEQRGKPRGRIHQDGRRTHAGSRSRRKGEQ
jgi:hypothetical protein